LNLSPLRSTLSRFSSPLSRQARGGLDPSVLPYVPKVIQEEQQKARGLQPLQLVLDVLQRGQYLTANMADEIQQSLQNGTPLTEATANVLKAAFQGISGKRKGDWETLLFGGNIEGGGERPGWLPQSLKAGANEPLIRWGQEGSTGLAEGILRPRKLVGLAANIALDPTTYLTFGASKLATATAGKYAEDVLKLTVATMGPEDFAKLGLNFSQKVGKNVENVLKAVGSNDVARRYFADVYNKAYQNALRNPAEKVVQDIAPQLEVAGQRAAETPGLANLIEKMKPAEYAGAGERSMGFLGKQFATGVRQPWLPSRAWDTIKAHLDTTAPGRGKLADAWYAIMNTGPIGGIKQAFGIRNPYEQMLHLKAHRISELGIHTIAEQETQMAHQVLSKYDQQTVDAARNATIKAEADAAAAGLYKPDFAGDVAPFQVTNKLDTPIFQQYLGLKPEQVGKVKELLGDIERIKSRWRNEENAIVQKVGMPENAVSDRINYFPQGGVGSGEMGGNVVSAVRPGGGTGIAKHKHITVEQRVQNNAEMLKFLMGDQLKAAWTKAGELQPYDEFVRQFVIDHNLADTSLDLAEAYKLRAIAHAKFMAKYNLIDEFRQFGVPIQDAIQAVPGLQGALVTYGQGTSKIGLYKVNAPGFEQYLFDAPTAQAITNVSIPLSSDQGTRTLARAFNYFTTMWKGFVTMTPGFHIRNWIQNNLTGFIKFGPRWFDLRQTFGPVAAGVAYALHPEKYADLLKGSLKVSDGWIAQQLNKRVGDFSVKELADWARQAGTIGSRTQIAEEGIGIGTKVNPFSKGFVGFRYSKEVGDVVENSAKFQSFLMDYMDIARSARPEEDLASRLASQKQFLEYADGETKKWFLEYSDLTPFEQKVMRKIIPFYAWLRKNAANQLSGLVLYPETYSVIPKVRGALTNDEDFNYSLMPDYMKNMGYYPVGKTAAGTNIMRWANIALEDLNKIPVLFNEGRLTGATFTGDEMLSDIMANAHPLIKTFVEMVAGKDLYHKRDIRPFERAAPVFQYLNNAPGVIQFLDGAMRTAGFENGIRIQVHRDGKQIEMDGKVQRVLDTNLPALRTLDMMISTPEVLAEQIAPSVQTWIERVFGKTDYYTGLQELFQVISRVGGMKFAEVSQEEQAKLKEAQMKGRLSQLKAQAEKDQLANEARYLRSRKTSESRNKRLFGQYTRGR